MNSRRVIFFCFFLALLFPASSSLFAFLADGFDAPRTEYILKRGDFVGKKKPDARVPFVQSKMIQDEKRGAAMEISFNVSEGFGGSYVIFREGKLPDQFNTVRFWVRGGLSAFKVELKDDSIHNFVVEKRSQRDWQEIVIPIVSFTNHENLNLKKIKEFVFVFEDHRCSPRLGTIDVDDLSFTLEKDSKEKRAELPLLTPGPVLINGDLPAERIFQASETDSILKLSSRIPPKAKFNHFRFEASADKNHWFYLSEFPLGGERSFEYPWKIAGFISGTYWVRGVFVDETGKRSEGAMSKIKLQNHFNANSFLDEIQKRTFNYFLEEVDSKTYLVKDRNTADSNYATGLSGFQMTAYVIGVERGWIAKEEALHRMNILMDFLLNNLPNYHGLIPHWFDSGRKVIWEIWMGDAVETTFVLAGALTARAYFSGGLASEISFRKKVDQFFKRIEWDALLARNKKEDAKGLLPWHWSLKNGASALELQGYNEAMMVYLLALGAPEHAIPETSWQAWASTYQKGIYGTYELISCAPLFTHQYSHLWVDFRNQRDRYTNYFENSILATLANREYSLKENNYSSEIWGLSASEGPNGYKAYGAPPIASLVPVFNDGTIAPTAAAGSIMFTPELSIAALYGMRERFRDKVWGKYGFKDAFNPSRNWFFDNYLGLDEGSILIAIENYRTGFIWRLFMQNPYIQEGLKKAGFKSELETNPIK